MISLYAFDNANVSGDKEAVIVPNPPTLVNKLSANETNNIKDKINEIIPLINSGAAPVAYLELRLKLKGHVGGVPNALDTLQVGDIVHGFADATTVWTNARYEGGDPTDRANYTVLADSGIEPVSFVAPITGINQVFALDFMPGSVLKSRGELYKGTEWTYDGANLTIIVNTNVGNTIYVKP